jgi:hypothetical protein
VNCVRPEENLQNLYSLPTNTLIRTTETNTRLVGHVARMGKIKERVQNL